MPYNVPVMKYHLYMLKCSDESLYTGITTDLERRLKEHNSSKVASKYTRARRPVTLVYSKTYKDRSSASIAEAQMKKLTKEEKLALIVPKV
jgi:putative endonuclease